MPERGLALGGNVAGSCPRRRVGFLRALARGAPAPGLCPRRWRRLARVMASGDLVAGLCPSGVSPDSRFFSRARAERAALSRDSLWLGPGRGHSWVSLHATAPQRSARVYGGPPCVWAHRQDCWQVRIPRSSRPLARAAAGALRGSGPWTASLFAPCKIALLKFSVAPLGPAFSSCCQGGPTRSPRHQRGVWAYPVPELGLRRPAVQRE